ncbi:MAG: phosphatidylserine decarboxylase [Sulfurovum sp.]|jgi:phosphatidylserine decarboxylase|nr:MAG: Phosphatidylserine decarboxylase proenzyme [Arcobacter lacus]
MHISNIISQYFGRFAKKEFPSFIQSFINNGYVKLLGLNMREFKAAKHYKSLNNLFTRKLEFERDIDTNEDSIISPCDSLITEQGSIIDSKAFQIKGMKYEVEELLTYYCKENFSKMTEGSFMNFYLSPKDYHRYHAPCDFKVTKLIHVPGKLYPVNLRYLKKEFELFVQNERVILECIDNNQKLFYMVFVGALNVGEMVFEFEPKVETNKDASEIKVYTYDDIYMSKGDCLGYFKMGSTVVMLWENDTVSLDNFLNQKVKFGQKIAKTTK